VKTAVDTNVLFDLLAGSTPSATSAGQALAAAMAAGALVICPTVYAELAAGFDDRSQLARFLSDLGVERTDFSDEALWRAAAAWRAYTTRRGQALQCSRCGRHLSVSCPDCQSPVLWRQHIISDFLIGGHASADADRLLTRDSGYYRTYFPALLLV
jgi:predicted nucleic acid-binding protein